MTESPLSLHLYSQVYPTKTKRLAAMREAIEANLSLNFISGVTLFSENLDFNLFSHKLIQFPTERRATFSDFLGLINEDNESSHFAILNSDIILTEDIGRLLAQINMRSTVIALTRREIQGSDTKVSPQETQDAWIFRTHQPNKRVIQQSNYELGIAGCEHLFASSLLAHGYNIWNPYFNCRIFHNDNEPKLKYGPSDDRLYGTYTLLPPCEIEDVERIDPKYNIVFRRLHDFIV